MRVLSIGECMAEFAPAATPGEYRLGFAGDTFNTAWYLARLRPDITVSFLTATGDDSISEQMRAAFAVCGIDSSHVRVVPEHTVGLYLISLDNGERSFSYWRGQSAARQLADEPVALARATETADLIYFSGITLAILKDAARQRLLAVLQKARASGKTVAFDPNLRRRLWSGPAEMTAAVMEGAAVCDIALPSYRDEADWFGDADPTATADRYASAGASTIIVKNGADPVHFRNRETGGTVSVPEVRPIVDTTAAGDSFNAAILAGRLDRLPLAESVARACRLAGHVVQGVGALVPFDPVLLAV
jgi:2-dehydro-3-deoxygluconokinase